MRRPAHALLPAGLATLALLAAPPAGTAPVAAQETRPLTEDAAASIVQFFNRATTTRVRFESRIGAGATVDGDVAALGGVLTVAGTVTGDVVVINGDLRLLPGARVDGAARITGGRLHGDAAAVAGGVVVHPEVLRFRREGEVLVSLGPERPSWPSAGWPLWFGRADVVVALDGSYNRVEGLPIRFGPRVQLGHSNPTVLDARLIYRTRHGLRVHPNEFGHDVRLQQYVGGHQGAFVGAALHRVIDPIESAGLSDKEASLTTFLLHEDFRDHYTRHGWSGYVGVVGRTVPARARLEYRVESHGAIEPGTPWSLVRNQDPWRPQPDIGRGELRAVRGTFDWDSRNDPVDPAAGWLVSVEVEQGVGGALVSGAGALHDAEFTAAALDVRRYLRLGPRTRLAVRAMAAGSADGGRLPPQRQRTLGAAGTLPGYPRFAFDCGARDQLLTADGFFPYHGCDRTVLLQAEARWAVFGDLDFGRRFGLDFDLTTAPELVLFTNAGRAWIEARALGDRTDVGPRLLRPDVGFGLRVGGLGAYLAVPLAEGGATNLFVRLGPRL